MPKTEANSILEVLNGVCDWEHAALPEAMGKLGELKSAYERIAAIVLRRQEKSPPKLFCWVWENRKTGYGGGAIPNSIVEQCRKIVDTSKPIFRDDGHYVIKHGVSVREPIVCCSPRCTDIYNRYRNDQKAKKLGANNSVVAGIELR